MRYLSTFSGIEAASVAWEPLGWTPVGFSEIDPFASAVLAHRFPGVKNYGDITKHESWDIEPGTVDVLVGGSPCQAFSVAGLRRGLDDPRGQLTLVYLQLAARLQPEWIVWENVPGVLSADGGRAFGAFLGALVELGYGFAYRVLDARFFGVPQRRRRVFLVARRAGDWRSAGSVLLEREGVLWNPPTSEPTRQDLAAAATGGARAGGRWWDGGDVAASLTTRCHDQFMPDKANFAAVIDHVGTLDCSCGGDKLQVQHATSGHLIPVVQDTMSTICTRSGTIGSQMVENNQVIPMVEAQFAQYRMDDSAGTLRSKGGTCGDGSETIVIERSAFNQGVNAQYQSFIGESDSVPTVIARGPHAVAYRKSRRAQSTEDHETWVETDASNTLNLFDQGDVRATDVVVEAIPIQDGRGMEKGQNGFGVGSDTDPAYTLDTTGAQSVCVSAVAIPIDGRNALRDPEKHDEVNRQGVGVGNAGDPAHTVTTACVHAVCFSCKDHGADAGDVAPTMRAMPHSASHANGGGQLAVAVDVYNQTVDGDCAATVTAAAGGTQDVVAFSSNMSVPDVRDDGCSPCLKLGGHGGGNPPAVCSPTMVVRRLLPVECERLQGFPDGWTAVPYRGKPASDGPRYKALGNSMAVPCMAWIGHRIQAVMDGKL